MKIFQNSGLTGGNFRLYLSSGDNNISVSNAVPVTKQELNYDVKSIQIYLNKGLVFKNYEMEVMLSEGSDEPNVFEPYTGGEPSPNPNYPQKIETITDILKIMSIGENILDYRNISKTAHDYGINIDEDDYIYSTNPTSDSRSWSYNNSNYFFNLPAGTFYIKLFSKNASQNTNAGLRLSDSDNLGIVVTSAGELNRTDVVKKFTLTQPKKLGLMLKIYDGKYRISITKKDIDWNTYFISKIEANLPTDEFVGKLNDTYKDIFEAIYNVEEKQYHLILNKNIIKIVMDGITNKFFHISSSIFSETNKFFQFEVPNKEIGKSGSINYAKSNYLTYFEGNAANAIKRSCFWWEGSEKYNYASLSFMTLEDANNWLKQLNSIGKPLEIYYVTSKPYQVDLGPIDMLKTYEDVTNIFTDSDLLPSIRIKYYKNFKETIKELKINEKSLKDELQSLSERLSALETKQVVSSDDSNVENEVIS